MFEMSRSTLRQRDGGLRAAMSEYGMLAALVLLIGLGSVTGAGVNMSTVFSKFVDWIAAAV